ncbi:WD40-repeat-containing domain protein [Gorgonomyces haynaldii]|nr:WD40-repeat-containing domain protein [Gorgonomyces haynaldii]
MKPILLAGHTRALTKIKYNREGDLLFSVSKDNQPCVWYSHNGERLGTFSGHNGTIWDLDVSHDSLRLLTASADSSCRMWSVENGKQLFVWHTKTAVRCVAFAEGDKMALFVTDAVMGEKCTIHIVQIEQDPTKQTEKVLKTIVVPTNKVTTAVWGLLNKTIITGHEDGTITVWDAKTGTALHTTKEQTAQITDIQFNKDKGFFISASKDHTALVYDSENLSVFRKFVTERPVNAAAISPIRPHIVLGGGQDAMSVTTTAARQGKFEARFFHLAFEDEIGRVKGHFGPINTIAFHPLGTGYASGGEDGYVRVHHFDPDYFEFKFPVEDEE